MQDVGNHARGGGFAVRTGHGDADPVGHQVAQKVGPFHHRDVGGAGGLQLRVALGNGAGNDHQVGPSDVGGGVAFVDGGPGLVKNGRALIRLLVRARHNEPTPQQHLSNRRNPRSADADQVNVHIGLQRKVFFTHFQK
jgi:hypothetical protein